LVALRTCTSAYDPSTANPHSASCDAVTGGGCAADGAYAHRARVPGVRRRPLRDEPAGACRHRSSAHAFGQSARYVQPLPRASDMSRSRWCRRKFCCSSSHPSGCLVFSRLLGGRAQARRRQTCASTILTSVRAALCATSVLSASRTSSIATRTSTSPLRTVRLRTGCMIRIRCLARAFTQDPSFDLHESRPRNDIHHRVDIFGFAVLKKGRTSAQ
jgi:hypothetical protein